MTDFSPAALTCPAISLSCEGDIDVTFPGGGKLFSIAASAHGTSCLDISKALLSQINVALMPFLPIFDIIDTMLLLLNCMQAVQEALGPPPDPTKLAECLAKLGPQINKLLKLIPQLSIPLFVVSLIDVVISFLQSLKLELAAIVQMQLLTLAAAARYAERPSPQLAGVISCSNSNIEVAMANLNQSIAPVNRLFGIVNALMKTAKLGELPTIRSLGSDPEAALVPLDAMIEVLTKFRSTIPVA